MKFKIVFYYMDGDTLELEVHPEDMKTLTNCLTTGEIFYSDTRGVGIWIPVDKIRYFQMEKVDESGRRVVESNQGVSNEDRGLEGGEEVS